MPERHPSWVSGINDFEARLASGAVFISSRTVDALDPLRVRSGIRDAGGYPGQVTLNTNSVTVNPFQAVIQDESRPGLGAYVVTLDAPKELPLTASDPALNRIDLVIAEVDATVDPGFVVRVVTGSPAASPVVPTLTNPLTLILAQVAVPAAGATRTLTDLRQFTAALGGILPVRGAGDLPVADGASSRFIYRLDNRQLQVQKGGQWAAYRPPRGSVDTWHAVTWPSSAGWANYGSGYPPVAYTITEDGWVQLRGLARTSVARTASSTVIYALPVDYRPAYHHIFTVFSSKGAVRLDVETNGNVTVQSTLDVNQWASLDGLSFSGSAYTT